MITEGYCRNLLENIKRSSRRDPWLILQVGRLANQLESHPDPNLERWFSVLLGAIYAKWGE